MALYVITNLTQGSVVLPPPLGGRLDKHETIHRSAPAGMTEANLNRKYSALKRMIQTGLISITTVEDPDVDDNVEVATVSMLRSGTGTVGIFTATIAGALAIGDVVCSVPGGIARVDVTDVTKVPAIGVCTQIAGPTATIQYTGEVLGYIGLTPGKSQFVSLTGRPSWPPPVPAPSSSVFYCAVGMARTSSILTLQPSPWMTKIFG